MTRDDLFNGKDTGPGAAPVLDPAYEIIRKLPYANSNDYDYLCYNKNGAVVHMRRVDIELRQETKTKFKREDLL